MGTEVTQIKEVLKLVAGYAGSSGVELVQAAYTLVAASCQTPSPPLPIPLLDQAIAAAQILAELETKAESVAAALLVDLSPDACPPAAIQEQAGEQVSQLVEGVRRMRKSPYLSGLNKLNWSDKEHSELYHAFVDALEDTQFILIELAHQLNKLRRLDAFSPAEQKRLATEVQHIYAPMAHRLGIRRLKWELEDLAFRVTHPQEYQEIARALDEQRVDRQAGIQQMAAILGKELDHLEVSAQVTGRPKHIHSIYRKMRRKGVSFDAIYDIRALRVLVDDIPTCYQALGTVHRLWTPIPGQIDDYIAVPKSNGYRSLHTAVTDDEGKTLEVQIRTYQMNETAELGVASHWRYKEYQGSKQAARKKKELEAEQAIDGKIVWLRSLLRDPDEEAAGAELHEHQSGARFIFVFTPMGDMIRLPAGATPIDLAYRIHTELGHRCSEARVNDNIVPLDYQLVSGDRVSIITKNRGGPSLDWLNPEKGFIKTSESRKKIGIWFRRQKREEKIAHGHEILDRELAKLGLKSTLSFDQVAQRMKFEHTDDMLVQIGSGVITPEKIRLTMTEPDKLSKDELAREADKELVTEKDETKTLIESEKAPAASTGRGLQVASTKGLLSQLAKCCYPIPPEEIVGYVTRGHGVTIHLADCPNVSSSQEPERIVPASWGEADDQTYPVMVSVEALNRRGLMGDIGQAVAKENIDINKAKAKKRAHWAVFELLLEVADAGQLERAMQELEQTKGVRTVYRKKG